MTTTVPTHNPEEQRAVRAILIDPEKQSLTEVQFETGDCREIQQTLGCQSFVTDAFLYDNTDEDSLYDDFDMIITGNDDAADMVYPRFWFQVDADRAPPSSCPLAGLGLAVGSEWDGNPVDVQISVEELRSRITFIDTARPVDAARLEAFWRRFERQH
jgi:hypothetical protein